MSQLIVRFGMAAGTRLLPIVGAPVSADTILREVRRAPTPTPPSARVLGVDEWALRKGHTYGTILVDLERRVPVDLLPERSADSIVAWLKEHPGAQVVTRDRSEIYAEGARRGAPGAIQVADRWHLLKNAHEVLERVLHRHREAFKAAITVVSSVPPAAPASADSAGDKPVHAPPRSSTRPGLPRQSWYEQIHALRREGMSIHAITAEVGLARVTVRKYLRATTCPTRSPRRTKVGSLTTFDAHLRARGEQGCHDAVLLWRELQQQGFRGSYRTIHRHVAPWRTALGDGTSTPASTRPSTTSMRSPSPRLATWWLVLPDRRLTAEQRGFV